VTYQHILYDVNDKIATITLNRPDRMNAWTPIMERDVRHAMEAAATDDNIRVIVLTGSGRAFCAGADMDALKGLDPDDVRRAQSLPPFDMNRRPDWQTRYAYYPSIPKPVIGMLNGATAGIGLVHALYCDLRFAADNTVFTTAFARRGLIAEHGISWMLSRIVGHANALDLLMSARRVSSEEALRIGLVNRSIRRINCANRPTPMRAISPTSSLRARSPSSSGSFTTCLSRRWRKPPSTPTGRW
jgi:enoyl-CoA hydratase/carnithine racemase